jgi:hypothetical protein
VKVTAHHACHVPDKRVAGMPHMTDRQYQTCLSHVPNKISLAGSGIGCPPSWLQRMAVNTSSYNQLERMSMRCCHNPLAVAHGCACHTLLQPAILLQPCCYNPLAVAHGCACHTRGYQPCCCNHDATTQQAVAQGCACHTLLQPARGAVNDKCIANTSAGINHAGW